MSCGGRMSIELETADDRLREGVARIGSADVVVGIPSFRNAATIGHVAATAARGLREHFAGARVAIINADGGSNDGTPDQVVESAGGGPVAVGRYIGPPRQGSALRAVFRAGRLLGARARAGGGSDLRGSTPAGVARPPPPITPGAIDYHTPP